MNKYIKLKAHNESFNSVGSEETDDTRDETNASGSGSGSSSGSDSDTESSSSSTESSDGEAETSAVHHKQEQHVEAIRRHSTPERSGVSHEHTHTRPPTDHQRNERNGGDPSKATVGGGGSSMVAGLPPQGKTNGYSDDDDDDDGTAESDSQSGDTNSDTNEEDDYEEDAQEASSAAARSTSERRGGGGGGRRSSVIVDGRGGGGPDPTTIPIASGPRDNSIKNEQHNTTHNTTATSTTSATNTSSSSSSSGNNTSINSDHNTSRTTNNNNDHDSGGNDDEEDDDDDDDDSSNDEHEQKEDSRRVGKTTAETSSLMVDRKTESVATHSKQEKQIHFDDDEQDDDEEDEANVEALEEASESAESTKSSDSSDHSPTASSSSSSSEDDEDDYQPKRPTRQVKKPQVSSEKIKKAAKKKKKKQNWDSDESDVSDDSDDSPRVRRKPAQKTQSSRLPTKKMKKASYLSEDSDDGDDSKRFGTRRAAAAVSYKEASEDEKTDSEDLLEVDEVQAEAAAAAAEEDEKCETIERILGKRWGKKLCTGNQTTIYAIEENGCDPNDGVEDKESELTEVQYLIKWKGWSYIHNTWESEDTLREQKVKGMKKLENFIKKESEIEFWRRYAGPEDIDYFECQLELQNDLLKSYNNVDRIIARNEKDKESCEYLCKWQSLPYAEATWEDGGLVMRKWQKCVEQYNDRELSKCTPSRHCRVLKYRPKFYKVKGQPEFLNEGLTLRDYQMDGLNWLLHSWCKENSVILADEMGLGKTIQTICFLYSLFKLHNLYGPFLCVVPLSTMTAWQREFVLWAPEMNVVTYLGDVKSREMIRQYEWQFDGSKRLKFNCILTTYEIVLKDKLFLGPLQWAAVMVDEAHRLKNDDSLLYKSLKEFETNHRLLITGTPLQNSLKELWALLHFIMPEKFITWEDFEKEHENAADKGYSKLHQQLEPYILRRVKKDVEKSLPAKVEQILRVEMTSVQKQYYKWILTKNFDALRKGKKGSTSTFLNIVIELKKCCNHAALIRPSEFDLMGMQQDEALQTLLKGSGKLVLLDKLLCRLKETGHRVLIFSQMVRMLDVLADYLQKRHFSFQRLDGSIKGEMRRQALDHFNAEGSQDFCFLLSTRAGGLGINLATADTVIIFDSDWNPQNDLQAQARAHRIGQKNQVNIYRLVTARSVEEQIVERAKQKMVLDHLVIQRMDTTGRTVLDKSGASSSNSTPFNKDDLSAILKFGAEELFKDEQENDDELVCDIDEILRRAETRNEDPEMPGDDLLSAFKVASIAAFEEETGDASMTNKEDGSPDGDDTKDWDDIIPENFRKVVENEERAKEMEDLYLPPRRKTATNQGNKRGAVGKRGAQVTADDSEGGSDYEAGSDASGDETRPKKRGRPAMKEKIPGFTDAEIRRFIKSYKKFPAPLMRLEAIACDAELQEKPLAELKRIGEMLHNRCVKFFEEHKDELAAATAPIKNTTTDDNGKQKRSRATFSLKLGAVSFNAKTVLSCEQELQPLNEILPATAAERLNWILNIKTRPANFDSDWGIEDDSKLLCGIYQYGIGSWEQMKMDPNLKLTEKILFNDARKPQAKHLQSRAEYLLKVIKKTVELRKGVQRKQRNPRKPREAKVQSSALGGLAANAVTTGPAATPERKSRNISESHGDDISQSGPADTVSESRSERKTRNRESISIKTAAGDGDGDDSCPLTENSSESSRKKSKRQAAAATAAGGAAGTAANKDALPNKPKKSSTSDSTNKPMHFTANNEPRALEVLGDLDPNIFNECKEKMRPVKKALKALDQPDSEMSNAEQVKHTRDCLLSIGRQIDICLEEYKEPEKKDWRSNLWYFVSKFTEFDAKKLFKMYKNALKMPEESGGSNTSFTGSPQKKMDKFENGGDRDKSAKKKKKDKDRERTRDEHYAHGGGGGFDKMKRVGGPGGAMDSPMKRKRDENDTALNPSGVGAEVKSMGSFKRISMDRSRDRNDERKKHRDDYYGTDRRINSPSTPTNSRQMQRLPPGPGNYLPGGVSGADNSGPGGPAGAGPGGDRWSHGRDRFGSSADYKRDRYDSYNRSGGGYHRDRDRDRRPEKRRYPPSHGALPLGYPGHYMPSNYYMGNGVLPPGSVPPGPYRTDPRYVHGGDWPRDYSAVEYRRDYDRRPQT